ncbi:hypothetical protein DSL92_01160 [Billgrantia gudaonensis]|uniref:TonB-dependent receptor n=1 Tax=Billgrantia gudaonensis TaxID=376427 RepID=A0A432JKR5_9GAMM|nr:hypothetical protein DSL92_01160 [Halomonas gudaonensis]
MITRPIAAAIVRQEYDRSNFFGEPDYNFHDVERSSITGMLTHDFANGLTLRGNLRYSDLTDDYGYVYITDSVARTGTLVDRGYIGRDRSSGVDRQRHPAIRHQRWPGR